MKNRFTFLLLIFHGFCTYAQQNFDIDFYNHLKQNAFDTERWIYLGTKQNKENFDTEIAKDFLRLIYKFSDTLSANNIIVSETDTQLIKYQFYTSILFQNNNLSQRILATSNNIVSNKTYNLMQELYNLHNLIIVDSAIETSFQSSINKIKFYQNKNALKAAFLSAIVPGLGKIYMSKNQNGVSTLISTLLFASPLLYQGLTTSFLAPLSIASGLFFIPFYLANIYGTYIIKKSEIKKLKLELYNETNNYCKFMLNN